MARCGKLLRNGRSRRRLLSHTISRARVPNSWPFLSSTTRSGRLQGSRTGCSSRSAAPTRADRRPPASTFIDLVSRHNWRVSPSPHIYVARTARLPASSPTRGSPKQAQICTFPRKRRRTTGGDGFARACCAANACAVAPGCRARATSRLEWGVTHVRRTV